MSSKMHSTVKCWSSSEEDENDVSESKYNMKLRDTLKSPVDSSTMEGGAAGLRRRGRGPSKRPCLNRNALMARENRQRKKAYLEKIENKLSFYQEENKKLVNTIREQEVDIKRLTGEVAYLRSVLKNSTSIATLLKTINDGLRKMNGLRRSHTNNVYPDSSNGDLAKTQNGHSYLDSGRDQFMNYHSMHYHQDNSSFYLTNGSTKNKEGSSLGTTVSSLSQESEDSSSNNIKDFDNLLPMTNFSSIADEKDDVTLCTDFDQLPSFSMDLFEDLPKCDDINVAHGLHDSTSLFAEEEMLPSLDNIGICLHVNADKVSLEYCSTCYSNSKGSGLNN